MYLCITNRKLCNEPLPQRIKKLNACQEVEKIILREKDLSEQEYETLAEQCLEVCRKPLVLHTYVNTAEKLGVGQIHLSMKDCRKYKGNLKKGVSVHSVEEAKEAELLGASYLIAGHIFHTECKKGLPPRGCDFFENHLPIGENPCVRNRRYHTAKYSISFKYWCSRRLQDVRLYDRIPNAAFISLAAPNPVRP